MLDGVLDEEWAAAALDAAREAGAEFADVRVVEERGEAVDVRDDRVEGVSGTSSRGVGIRVLAGGTWGFAATNDAATTREVAQRAVDIARASAPLRGEPVRLADTPRPAGRDATPAQPPPPATPVAEEDDQRPAPRAGRGGG